MIRRLRSLFLIGVSLTIWTIAETSRAQSPAPSESATQETSNSDRIAAAVDELSDTKFARRQSAYHFLVEAGIDAITDLEQSARAPDIGVAERCVKALAEIAKDTEYAPSALAALDRIADDESSMIAKLAASESKQLKMSDEERAIIALEVAGVRIQRNREGDVFMVSILRDHDLFWLKFLPELRYVALMQPQITDRGIEYLHECDQIESLAFHQTSVTDAGLAKLPKLAALTNVSLSGENVTPEGISSLRNVLTLRSLSWQSPISDLQMEALGDLKQISSLRFSSVKLPDNAPRVINSLDQLSRLSLVMSAVTNAQCEKLAQIKAPSSVSIMRSPGMTAKGWNRLSEMNLQSLMIFGTSIIDYELPSIGQCTSLTSLSISDAPISDAGLAHLKTLTNLRYLNLRGTKVTEAGGNRLKMLLPKLSKVRISSSR